MREEPEAPKKKAPPTPPAHVATAEADGAEAAVPPRELQLDDVDDVVVVTEPEADLSGRTIKELRELCSQQGLSSTGRKADLVERLRQS